MIADEPTTALDVTTQSQILALLKGLVADFDIGMIMITHDLAVVNNMAHKISVMHKGEIVEKLTSAIFRNMKHPYTKMLFNASSHKVALPTVTKDPLLRCLTYRRLYIAKN